MKEVGDESASGVLPPESDYESFSNINHFKITPIRAGRATYRDIKDNVFTIDEWLDINIEISHEARYNPKPSLF